MSVKLEPCPFCGNKEPEVERYGTNRQSCIVICGMCGCRLESNEDGAGHDWNLRVPSDATRKMVEMQQNMLDVLADMNLPQFYEEQEAQRAFIAEWRQKK